MTNDPDYEWLFGEAMWAALNGSYSPYSQFKVGCALLTDTRMLHTGANIENASYGLTICSERTAIFNAVAMGRPSIHKLLVVCPDASALADIYKMPCGACRQVMAEFATPDFKCMVVGVGEFTMEQLLPKAFTLR